jgi:hypothetical protein
MSAIIALFTVVVAATATAAVGVPFLNVLTVVFLAVATGGFLFYAVKSRGVDRAVGLVLAALAFLFIAFTVVEGGENDNLSPAAKRSIASFDRSVETMRTNFVAQYEREKAKLIVELEKEQAAVTRTGNLEGALAIKAKVDAIKAKPAADVMPGADILGNPIASPAAGGNVIAVEAANRFGTPISGPCRLFPFAEDKWNSAPPGVDQYPPVDYLGYTRKFHVNRAIHMSMIVVMEDGSQQQVVDGLRLEKGEHRLLCNDNRYADNSGSIRVRVERP